MTPMNFVKKSKIVKEVIELYLEHVKEDVITVSNEEVLELAI